MADSPPQSAGLPPPPLSTSTVDENDDTPEYGANEPNKYQNDVLGELNTPVTDEQEAVNTDSSNNETELHNIDDNPDSINNAINIENDMKLSLNCMATGELQFNTFYEDLQFVQLSRYTHGIPTGLEGLKRRLIERGGLNYEGIFRLRGNEEHLNTAKQQMNDKQSISVIEVSPIEVAQLIKAFYRSIPCDEPGFLPHSLLNATTDADIIHEFAILSEPRKSLLLWSFDLWIKIEEFKPKNKMTLQSMSIVFSPNMVRSADPNPMTFLELQKKVQRVIHDAAKLRNVNQLIARGVNDDSSANIVPFQRDRSVNNEHTSCDGPKYVSYNTNRNRNNASGISNMFNKCVVL